jgi:hypothetical protein
MENEGASQHYRKQAGHHYASAQECLDYADSDIDPRLRDAWKRVASCEQDLAIALDKLASVTDEIDSQPNSN